MYLCLSNANQQTVSSELKNKKVYRKSDIQIANGN